MLQYLDTMKALQATHKAVYQQATDVAFGFFEALCPAIVFRTDPSLVVSNGLCWFLFLHVLCIAYSHKVPIQCIGLTHALSDTVKKNHPSLGHCHLTDTIFWLLQTCFRDNQAGQILMDLLKWWLDYNVGSKGLKPYLEPGFELRKPELFVSDLLSYAQQTF